jgi:hypothetical protein
VRHQSDALPFHLLTESFTEHAVEMTHQARASIGHGHLRAQSLEDAGELDRNVTSSDDQDPARLGLQLEDIIGK